MMAVQKVAAVIAYWAGAPEAGEQVIAPLRKLGTVVANLLAPIPYVALRQLVAPMCGSGAANYLGLPSSTVSPMMPSPPTPIFTRSRDLPVQAELHIDQLGGAMGRVSQDATRPRSPTGSRRSSSTASREHQSESARAAQTWGDACARRHGCLRQRPTLGQLQWRGRRRQSQRRVSDQHLCSAATRQRTLRSPKLFRYNQNVRPSEA